MFFLLSCQFAEAGTPYSEPPERDHTIFRPEEHLFIMPDRRLGLVQLGMSMNEIRSILREPDEERMVEQYDIYHLWDYGHTRFHFTNGILKNWME